MGMGMCVEIEEGWVRVLGVCVPVLRSAFGYKGAFWFVYRTRLGNGGCACIIVLNKLLLP